MQDSNFNPLMSFYTRYNISPVKQDISDFESHYMRRNALFRELGILPSFLKNKKILEVGPGGGYNSIVLASTEPQLYTLLEPNFKAREDMDKLFDEFQIKENKNIQIEPLLIEDFKTDGKYDLVMCEGMVSTLPNRYEIINKMDSLVDNGGILLLSCADPVSTFFENIRNYFAYELTKDIDDFYKKVDLLVEVFGPHLKTLVNFTRVPSDWCIDNLIGDGSLYQNLSMGDCINHLSRTYNVFHSNPSFVCDYTWYKKIPLKSTKYNDKYISKFNQIHHNLLHYKSSITNREEIKNIELLEICSAISKIILDIKHKSQDKKSADLINLVEKLKNNISDLDDVVRLAVDDILEILYSGFDKNTFEKYQTFKEAFGRGQQYISFVKN